MANNFKVIVSIKKQPKDEPVFQKHDGERFQHSCHTVKLNTNAKYTVTVLFRPEKTLTRLQIQGERAEFSRVKLDKNEDDACQYQAEWSTIGSDISKSGKRKEVPLVLEMTNGVTMKVTLQVKFYKDEETVHCCWGQELHSIQYECYVPDGCTFVDVKKEKYL
ncbi:CB1 cannabinoid receptor-interacting protein 1-like [Gigantopelta aegis]|uniref:CB1 cannabinoid receptor-interacting protein 1-like n=1 Tax=Gigantopelta aegis TaxID=1735272 RepID=UPI001B88A5A9|nr:CB1 cannabinoid receptor-interacting protein 1-like [Gigantopelta aegis]